MSARGAKLEFRELATPKLDSVRSCCTELEGVY